MPETASSHQKLFISLAFSFGVLLTLGFKDFYPDLERRFRRKRSPINNSSSHLRRKRSAYEVALEDHTAPEDEPSVEGVGTTEDIVDGIEGCIGNTPLVRIKSLSEATGCEILAKAEFMNGAGGSPKDRVALGIIDSAEDKGMLAPGRGDVIYEGTAGSTGISLATLCRARGYLAHICMSSDQSLEKSSLLLRLGAVVERTPPTSIISPLQFVNRARSLAVNHNDDSSRPGHAFFADQFENEANWRAHFQGTGPEIYAQTGGRLDAFVAGAGTGGTIAGVAKYLKPRRPELRVVLADPQGSGLYNKVKYGVMFDVKEREGTRRRHQVDSIVEGIGCNRLTANFEAGSALVDDAVRVTDRQALGMARWLVEKDGIFVGSSSAVNCVAAVEVAKKLGPGHRIVTILCDSGTRHLSKFWAQAGEIGGSDEMKLEEILHPAGDD